MSYTPPTASDFQARFARFSTVSSTSITAALGRAGNRVDDTWAEEDYAEAIMLYAAHELTLDGFGTGAESEAALAGAAGFTRMKSGSLELQRDASAAGGSTLSTTSYGKRFLDLLRQNRGGPLVTGAPSVVQNLTV